MKTSLMLKIILILLVLMFIGVSIFVTYKSPKQQIEEEIKLEID